MPDLHEALWQNMLEITPDELKHIKRTFPGSFGADLVVLESDLGTIVIGDPGIGDGYAEDVSTQVCECALAISN